MNVVCTVYGFVKKQMGTGRILERGECSLPPLQYATRAFWLDVGETARRRVEEEGLDLEVCACVCVFFCKEHRLGL